ncbi:MAG: hypothetical protein OXH14_06880 [Alphaproteobacteria bacterium]|nr:hypothetical protein [Alphaproteobacteria bacterium]
MAQDTNDDNTPAIADADEFVVPVTVDDGAEEDDGGDDPVPDDDGNGTLLGGGMLGGGGIIGGGLTSGEDGPDTFVFVPGNGQDTIRNFTDGEDTIDLSAFDGISAFSDLTATQDGEDVVIDLSDNGGGSITIENFSLSDLDDEDFIFHDAGGGAETPVDGF